MTASGAAFRFVSTKRRAREHRRFVVGKGRFAGDIRVPGMLHVALVASDLPAGRILDVDAGDAHASAMIAAQSSTPTSFAP
jgi:2-furoyl-CoA dehydrogenase large subunit